MVQYVNHNIVHKNKNIQVEKQQHHPLYKTISSTRLDSETCLSMNHLFFLQEDVINTQCGYDIRAKPVSGRTFIFNKALVLK